MLKNKMYSNNKDGYRSVVKSFIQCQHSSVRPVWENPKKTQVMFQLTLVSGNWAHALNPMLPEDQTTQAETSILPNWCHPIKIK